jgi:hypothetical protein
MQPFLEKAWADHGDRPADVADRLPGALAWVGDGSDAQGLARLAVHVLGEHLGDWARGIGFVDTLAAHCSALGDAEVERALARGRATLRLSRGDADADAALDRDDRIAAQAGAAAALAGRGEWRRAIALYARALADAKAGLADGSPALRALAVAGNNLAAALEEKQDRDADETAGMVMAAQGGLDYWRRAGTWLEHERAEYRLAMSLLAAGRAGEAAVAAGRCIEVCNANDAPAFERFFACAALARARRAARETAAAEQAKAQALAAYADIAPDERSWCNAELAALQAAVPGGQAAQDAAR